MAVHALPPRPYSTSALYPYHVVALISLLLTASVPSLIPAAEAAKPSMGLWGFRWFKLFLNPYVGDDFEYISESDRRIYILGRLEGAKFSEYSWVVVVAGVGFFTDAYSIFAINMVIPMLGIIYYGGTMPHNYETALSVVTLGGSILGQIGFGLGADFWGRRKMYGLELIITIGATLGCVMASNGIDGSMSVIVWLLIWRFVLGIGIGADYPLSAVICSEFAPTRLRGRMLTVVFMCQPLGQLAATLVALVASANQRNGIPNGATVTNCTGECLKTLDSIWRWVIGVGVIPAVIAVCFRLTIIESPRYTADVGQDSRKAASELKSYLPSEGPNLSSSTSINIPSGSHPLTKRNSTFVVSKDKTSPLDPSGRKSHLPPENVAENVAEEISEESTPPPKPSWKDFKDYFWHQGNLRTLLATSLAWFCVDLPFYGLGMNSPHIITTIWYGENSPPEDLYSLLVHNVWQSLVVVSIGAAVGCVITFVAIDKLGRRNIQLIGFFWLFILFIIIGGAFNHLYQVGGSSAIIVLYILCQIFFNFGPNTTTYILPAELFPTRYRGLCHGISAAFGKLGSVLAQLFLAYINYGHGVDYNTIQKWLPYSLLIFSFFMLCGLAMTVFWIPRFEHNLSREVKTLEDWEVGRDANNFSKTKLALLIARVYHWVARVGGKLYMSLDKISGGEEAERRLEEREAEGMMMEDMNEGHDPGRATEHSFREDVRD